MGKIGRRGRPRKHKEREPSGRGSRAAAERENKAFGAWQRRYLLGTVPPARLLDQKAEAPLGQLYLAGRITLPEYEVGDSLRRMVRRYRKVCGMPLELPSRQGIRGSDNRDFPDYVIAAARSVYGQTRRRVKRLGVGVWEALTRLCVDERKMRTPTELELAKLGLSGLLEFGAGKMSAIKRRPPVTKDSGSRSGGDTVSVDRPPAGSQ